MQNVEFKSELRDPELAHAICKRVGAVRVGRLTQRDTYFRVPDGRLKKRECEGEGGREPIEWVFYHRENRAQPKISRFTIYSEDEARVRYGTRELPVWVVVKKERTLWLLGSVRIHIDEVEGLGTFLEFEALVSPKQPVTKCHEKLRRLREDFSIVLGESISCGYADLIAAEKEAA